MNYENIIEAILFVSGSPISAKDLSDKLDISTMEVQEYCKKLKKKYGGVSGIHLLEFGGKYQFARNSDYVSNVDDVLNPIKERELSRSMLEVCAIVAYKQPVTRGEIDDIRNVNSDYAVSVLQKNKIIHITGKRNSPGRPSLFGTTDEFLKRFQLVTLKDLPPFEVLMERIALLAAEDDSSDLFKKDEYVHEETEIPDFLKDDGGDAEVV